MRNILTYKLLLFTLVALFLACGHEDVPDEPRPGHERPPQQASITFAPGQSRDIDTGGLDGALGIVLSRSGEYLPETEYPLTLDAAPGFASLDGPAVFGKGETYAVATLRYNAFGQKPGDVRELTLRIKQSEETLKLRFVNRALRWSEPANYVYFCNGQTRQVQMAEATDGASKRFRILGENGTFERIFTLDDTKISVQSTGGVADAALVATADAPQCFKVPSEAENGIFALNVLAEGEVLPQIEYYFPGETLALCTVCDGWLLPGVMLGTHMLSPTENTWLAPVLILENTLRVVGPYHHASPLHALNGSRALAAWEISIAGNRAHVAPQHGAFECTALFAFDFTIAGEGTVETKGGQTVITIPEPLHNVGADGKALAQPTRTWNGKQPTLISYPASEPCKGAE